jgi:hypothetical protein
VLSSLSEYLGEMVQLTVSPQGGTLDLQPALAAIEADAKAEVAKRAEEELLQPALPKKAVKKKPKPPKTTKKRAKKKVSHAPPA